MSFISDMFSEWKEAGMEPRGTLSPVRPATMMFQTENAMDEFSNEISRGFSLKQRS